MFLCVVHENGHILNLIRSLALIRNEVIPYILTQIRTDENRYKMYQRRKTNLLEKRKRKRN